MRNVLLTISLSLCLTSFSQENLDDYHSCKACVKEAKAAEKQRESKQKENEATYFFDDVGSSATDLGKSYYQGIIKPTLVANIVGWVQGLFGHDPIAGTAGSLVIGDLASEYNRGKNKKKHTCGK